MLPLSFTACCWEEQLDCKIETIQSMILQRKPGLIMPNEQQMVIVGRKNPFRWKRRPIEAAEISEISEIS